jgi:S1-C subfamily serine protease
MRRFLAVVVTLALGTTAGVTTTTTLALTPEEENTIDVYEALLPSVVTIVAETITEAGSPLGTQAAVSLGSGFAIEAGLVVTNYHVIDSARRILVVLHDGRREIAGVVGTAPGFDLAVLRVPFSAEELLPAPLGTVSDLRVGQKVLTVSSPLGLHHSVTVGVVSSLYRELPGLDLGPNLIQFDAPLNRGQSGGPLADSDGRVIGVTTAKVEQAEAIGFAIPVDVVANILPDLTSMGHAFQPQLGFSGTTVTPELAALFDLPAEHGVLVESTVEGSVAWRAGLRPGARRVYLGRRDYILGGDILVALNGVPIRGTGDLVRRLLASRPGERLVLTVTDGLPPRSVEVIVPEMVH